MISCEDFDFDSVGECYDEFWRKIETLAEKYEVTCDYILEEFILD